MREIIFYAEQYRHHKGRFGGCSGDIGIYLNVCQHPADGDIPGQVVLKAVFVKQAAEKTAGLYRGCGRADTYLGPGAGNLVPHTELEPDAMSFFRGTGV
jgi:hypothetical protein